MDDIGQPPFDSSAVELWIQKELINKKPPDFIADELLKHWEKNDLLLAAKQSTGRFCYLNGFLPSLVRIMRSDLRQGRPLPWGLILQVFLHAKKKVGKELADGFLAGATRDKQLHGLAAQALRQGHPDARWSKIFASELNDRLAEARDKRLKMLDEIKIFKNEGMDAEVRELIARILAMFPDDSQVKNMSKLMGEAEMDKALARMRKRHDRRPVPTSPEDEAASWPELEPALERIKQNLSLNDAYHLAIALHEMGLHEYAVETLRVRKEDWAAREKVLESELLNAQKRFAEALNSSQIILAQHKDDPEAVRAALYNSAKAYYGLEDVEQALSILRGIVRYDPAYRDAAVLLVQWEVRLT